MLKQIVFTNSGILMLLSIIILYILGREMDGVSIIAIFLMGIFGLFGKNLFNIWFIIFWVILYSFLTKTKVRQHIPVAFFGTSLAPPICFIYTKAVIYIM